MPRSAMRLLERLAGDHRLVGSAQRFSERRHDHLVDRATRTEKPQIDFALASAGARAPLTVPRRELARGRRTVAKVHHLPPNHSASSRRAASSSAPATSDEPCGARAASHGRARPALSSDAAASPDSGNVTQALSHASTTKCSSTSMLPRRAPPQARTRPPASLWTGYGSYR